MQWKMPYEYLIYHPKGAKSSYVENVLNGCVDAYINVDKVPMSRLILKYGPDMLEKIEQKEMQDTHCEETDNVL